MCGIVGILSSKPNIGTAALAGLAKQMGDALFTRGPDDSGVWVEAEQGVALSHRRLSILDLSPEGHQPMVSASGRYVISFNGEIYNYQELRAQLEIAWRGTSDTEVMLAAIEQWGIDAALPKFNGMFGFAIWDKQEKILTLARDRMGEKPVYYGLHDKQFIFASELKAFRSVSGWPPAIRRDAITLLMRYSYIPEPHSIYENIYKLEPGYYLQVKAGQTSFKSKPYWSFEAMVEKSIANRLTCSEKEATDQLEAILKFAVKQRMMSDVPLGAFLSGGIDSSSVVSLMQAQSSRPIQTFTIGFKEQAFNEAPYAKAVAKHLGTNHTEVYISPNEAEAVIPNLSDIYDEPFADSSQIPTYLVSKVAKSKVTVSLSGDGGDEIFGGYNRYSYGAQIWAVMSKVPFPLRSTVAKLLMIPHHLLIGYINPDAHSLLERVLRKVTNVATKMSVHTAEEFYRNLTSLHTAPEKLVIGGNEPLRTAEKHPNLKFAEWMMMQDALTYFPSDILTKVDRAAMAVSLETRTPFTDPEVMAFAWRLPLSMRIQNGKGKWLLRQMLYRYVPKELIERPKAGFAVPIGMWLRGPLKIWAADLLSPERLKQQVLFNAEEIQKIWQLHQSGERDLEHQLWSVLMFQDWYNNR